MAHLFSEGQININLDRVVSWVFSFGETSKEDDALIVEFDHELEHSSTSQYRHRWYYRSAYGSDIDMAYDGLKALANRN